MTGRWDFTDGDKPGEGEVVGFAMSLPTGLIHVKVDAYLTPEAADFARLQFGAAINDVKRQGHAR